MLDKKTIIVTGSSSGIGQASAQFFAASGANVVVADVDEKGGLSTVDSIIATGGEACFRRCNITQEGDVASMVAFTVEKYGKLDGAFNNAGVVMRNKPIYELTAEDWQIVIDVNLTGMFYCMKHEILAMKETGGGSIVNTASTAGMRGLPNAADYVASKHGVIGLTKSSAVDAGPLGIRINAVCPGTIVTPMAEKMMSDPAVSDWVDGMRKRHIVGRFGMPSDVAKTAAWLLSDLSSFTTGTPVLVDGGFSLC